MSNFTLPLAMPGQAYLDTQLLPLICKLADGDLALQELSYLERRIEPYPELCGLVDFLRLLREPPSQAAARAQEAETEVAYAQLLNRLEEKP